MQKGRGGMMKGQGLMKSEDMKGMGKSMGDMSGMMGEMEKRRLNLLPLFRCRINRTD